MNRFFQLIIFCFLLLSFVKLEAQQRNVISSNGGSHLKEGIYLTQTIGQDASFTQKTAAGQYFAQGFQQPMQKSRISINEINPTVFPNPNNRAFTITDLPAEPIRTIQLYDAKGALLTLNYIINPENIQCDMKDYPAGVYILNILWNSGENKSLKIIKTVP
jgi:hypothetical protein